MPVPYKRRRRLTAASSTSYRLISLRKNDVIRRGRSSSSSTLSTSARPMRWSVVNNPSKISSVATRATRNSIFQRPRLGSFTKSNSILHQRSRSNSMNRIKKPHSPVKQPASSSITHISRSRSRSRDSIASARSRSRSVSPIYPKSHFRRSVHQHGPLNHTEVSPEYQINREISNLAAQFTKSRRRTLPPVNIPQTSGSTQWPLDIPVYVISINDSRQMSFKRRFRYPATIWPGTNGRAMDINKIRREGYLLSNHLTRGEIGCYDSHVRLWESLVRSNTQMAIICEDDVNLTGDSKQCQYLNTLLSEFKTTGSDLMFLSWFRPAGGNPITTYTRKQWCFNQLWGYLVTLSGLKKLLNDKRVRKMHVPVDVAIWESHSRGVVRNLVAYPPLCLTVGERSDTRNIR